LAHKLSYGVSIICIRTHDVAMSMSIKILDRKTLHFVKHGVSEVAQSALSHYGHDSCVRKSSNQTCCIHYDKG